HERAPDRAAVLHPDERSRAAGRPDRWKTDSRPRLRLFRDVSLIRFSERSEEMVRKRTTFSLTGSRACVARTPAPLSNQKRGNEHGHGLTTGHKVLVLGVAVELCVFA